MALRAREKILLFFVLIALAIWAFDGFYYTPQRQTISRLREEIKVADQKLKESHLLKEGVEALEAEVSRLEGKLQGFSQTTLRREELRTLLRHLAKESDRLKIKIISLSPQEEMGLGTEEKKRSSALSYRRIALEMVFHAPYASLGPYLRGVESLPMRITLDHLQVERDEEIEPLLKVTLGLTVHAVKT